MGGRARSGADRGGRNLKLGMLTSCMPERSLEEIAKWAAAAGYETLELAAWPSIGLVRPNMPVGVR